MTSRVHAQRGVVLLVVLITIVLMMALIASILTLSSNQQRATLMASSSHIRSYYRAHAGIVDARERIRRDNSMDGLFPNGAFATASYDPPAYYIDLATDNVHTGARQPSDDVRVDIGPLDTVVTGTRSIESTGLE